MTISLSIHVAQQHRSARPGIEAISVLSNRHFPRHAHDQFGVGVLLSGAQRTWSRIGTVEAQAGQVITVNPGEMHDGVPLGREPRGWLMLYLDPNVVVAEIGDELGESLEIAKPALWDWAAKVRIERLFAQMIAAHPDGLELEQDLVRTLVTVFGQHGTIPSPTNRYTPSVTSAIRLLDDRPESSISLRELADLSGVSRYQLLRGFAREVGTTPHAYLLQRRVRTARRLLKAGLTPVKAAAESGFADQSHMTRVFVRQLGITPARYRAAVA